MTVKDRVKLYRGDCDDDICIFSTDSSERIPWSCTFQNWITSSKAMSRWQE